MPTIIDSLLVTLGLDGSAAKKGHKEIIDDFKKTGEEATKQAKEIEARGKQAAQFYSKIRNEVLSLTAAYLSAGAIKSFVENITASDAAVGRLSKNVGLSTESLSAWEGVAKKFGSSAADIDSAFRNTAKIATEIQETGTSSALMPFQRLGVDMLKFSDRTTTTEQRVKMLQAALAKMPAAQAQMWGSMAGFSETTINMLRETSGSIDDLLEQQRKLNVTTEADAEQAKQRAKAWSEMSDVFASIGRTLVNELSPVLLQIVRDFGRWVNENKDWIATGIVDVLRTFVSVATSVADALGGWLRVTQILFGLWIGSKVLAVVTSIANIASGTAALAANALSASSNVAMLLGKLGLLAAAGSAGWWVGTKIQEMLPDKVKDAIGGTIAEMLGENPPASVQNGTVARRAASSSAPRGIRNNNPGNLNYAGQQGATKEEGEKGRFAVFASMEEGISALARQLQIYSAKGVDTIRGIISKYAPPNENKTEAYIQSIVKKLGVGAEQHLDLNKAGTLKELIKGITDIEVGKGRVSESQIDAGLALRAGQGLNGRGAVVRNNNTSSTDVKIGQLTIQTQATDANGIARDIGSALEQYSFTSQAQVGLI